MSAKGHNRTHAPQQNSIAIRSPGVGNWRPAAIRTTDFRSVKYLVHDFSDGAGAATASSSGAKAAKNIAGGSARRSVATVRTSVSLRTLQEQTIIGGPLALNSHVCCNTQKADIH